MRTVEPALNDGFFDEEYLRVFNFRHLGKNVRIHKTVCLPHPKNVSIGDNVEIGPYCVLTADNIEIGNNVEIQPLCILRGESVEIPEGTMMRTTQYEKHYNAVTDIVESEDA